jgi:hypothetical protein
MKKPRNFNFSHKTPINPQFSPKKHPILPINPLLNKPPPTELPPRLRKHILEPEPLLLDPLGVLGDLRGWGVAVVGWQWCHSTRGDAAVILVVVRLALEHY